MVDFDVVMLWMQYIRNNPDNAYRFSENFWDSQIESKKWLLEHVTQMDKSIVIFGGWYGVLAQFVAQKFPESYIVTTDLDPTCETVFDQINTNSNIRFRTHDMEDGMPIACYNPKLVINTSTEHVSQSKYNSWWYSIPDGTKYIVQGNNLVNPEHIRLADNLEMFLNINKVKDPLYAGMLRCGHFYRFMAVGVK